MRLDDSQLQLKPPSPPNHNPLPSPIAPSSPKRTLSWLSGSRGLLLGLGLGVLLTFGASRWFSRPETTAQTPSPVAVTQSNAPTQAVTIDIVRTVPVQRTLKATGTVTAEELIPILSQATGLQIQEIFVEEGDWVEAGQPLARLDDSVLQAQLNQASAGVAQAQARLAELRAGARPEEIARAQQTMRRIEAEIRQAQSDRELAKKRTERNRSLEVEGAIARDRLDEVLNEERNKDAIVQQAEARLAEAQQQLAELKVGTRREIIAQAVAQLAEAQSRLQIVKAQLKDTRILAPISGKVAERNARVGDTTNGQNPLFKIIEKGRLELALKVPETQLSAIRMNIPVLITSDADKTLKLTGRVREINPVVEEASRQATVKVDISNAQGLKPGMFLRGAIVTDTAPSLTVPMAAVLPQGNNQATIYVIKADNKVEARAVTLGQLLTGDRVEILSGLSAGDRIVAKGAAYLGDGDKIRPKPEIKS